MWIFLIIIFILLIPIPLKFTVLVEDIHVKVYFYKFLLFPKIKEKNKKDDSKNKSNEKEKKQKKKNKRSTLLKNKITIDFVKRFINSLNRNPIKIRFKLKFNIEYSLEDAANSALLIGPLYNIIMIFINILNIPFKVNVKDLNVYPRFLDKNKVNISSISIIYINIVKLLYVLILLLKNLFLHKEVKPLRDCKINT